MSDHATLLASGQGRGRVTKRHSASRRLKTCDKCRSSHQKCSGTVPCAYCKIRNLGCTYNMMTTPPFESSSTTSDVQSQAETLSPLGTSFRPNDPHPTTSLLTASSAGNALCGLSEEEYSILRDRIIEDMIFLRHFQPKNTSNPPRNSAMEEEGRVGGPLEYAKSRLNNSATLPSFHQAVSLAVQKNLGKHRTKTNPTASLSGSGGGSQALPFLPDSDSARRILRDSLPQIDVGRRLLQVFLDSVNILFYVLREDESRRQLENMYEKPETVSLAWFCQMFFVFGAAVQYDDLEDSDGSAYTEVGRKYLNDAFDEDYEGNVWVIRAMLLLCFTLPVPQIGSMWIYLDNAIRRAQKHQLDIGRNDLGEMSDEAYQDWRQIWFTIISVDRWNAVCLGRVPNINEAISRDSIFKMPDAKFGDERLCLQNTIVSLSIITGFILRDVYFVTGSEETRESSVRAYQKYKHMLDVWLQGLDGPVSVAARAGNVSDLSTRLGQSQLLAHCMYNGSLSLLTRPLLLEAVGANTSAENPCVGTPRAEAVAQGSKDCINAAIRIVLAVNKLTGVSVPQKRTFFVAFFLVNAAYTLLLGAIWDNGKHLIEASKASSAYLQVYITSTPSHGSVDEAFSVFDLALRVLDTLGQRSMFARKYGYLLKEIRNSFRQSVPTPSSGAPASESRNAWTTTLTPFGHTIANYWAPASSNTAPILVQAPPTLLGQIPLGQPGGRSAGREPVEQHRQYTSISTGQTTIEKTGVSEVISIGSKASLVSANDPCVDTYQSYQPYGGTLPLGECIKFRDDAYC